jgi:hypothetical protein
MTSLLLRDSLLDFKGSKLEHRHLDFFYSQTAPSLAGYFDSRFWSILVPQLACSEPSVQHAMIALASFHEHSNVEDTSVVDHSKSLNLASRLVMTAKIKMSCFSQEVQRLGMLSGTNMGHTRQFPPSIYHSSIQQGHQTHECISRSRETRPHDYPDDMHPIHLS